MVFTAYILGKGKYEEREFWTVPIKSDMVKTKQNRTLALWCNRHGVMWTARLLKVPQTPGAKHKCTMRWVTACDSLKAERGSTLALAPQLQVGSEPESTSLWIKIPKELSGFDMSAFWNCTSVWPLFSSKWECSYSYGDTEPGSRAGWAGVFNAPLLPPGVGKIHGFIHLQAM